MKYTRISYVHPFDPCGTLILKACGEGWSGDRDLPCWTESEYLRGQCETVSYAVRLMREDEHAEGLDWEVCMDRAWRLIAAAAVGRLDELDPAVALSNFADEFRLRFVDDYILGDTAAQDAFASDALQYAALDVAA